MRIGCILFPHFAVQVEIRDNILLRGKPAIIGGFPHERKLVFDCSAEAAQLGISPGLTLQQAYHLCPDAFFMPLDESRYIQAFNDILSVLDRFSSAVEVDTLGKAFLDISGLGRLFRVERELASGIAREVHRRTGFLSTIGLGGNKFVAAVAATMASPEEPLIVTWGEERRFLQPMPVELLPISEGTKRMLRLLGLDTLGQIASLPVDAVITQFGQEGFLAHRLASGMDERPLMPRARPAILEDELTVDDALQTAEPLVVAIGLLLARLLSKLRAHNRVCGQVRLRLELDDGGAWCDSFTLKSPSNSEGEIMMLLKHRLETAHFPAGVTNISLVLCDLSSEQGTQSPLLQSDRVRQEAQLKHAVKRLKVRFGRNPLKRAVSLDPQSRIPERRAGLIEFEP